MIKQVNKPISVRYNQKQITLTNQEKEAIKKNWNKINKDNYFFNGEIYSVVDKTETDNELIFTVSKTNYSHYLYSNENDMGKNQCQIIYTDSILITNDNKLVLGVMNMNTASPNCIQCIGGSIDDNDLVENQFDLKGSIIREVKEELGLDLKKESLQDMLIKTDGDLKYTGIMFYVNLSETESDIREIFNLNTATIVEQGMLPELQEIIFLDLNSSVIKNFQQENGDNFVDYMSTLLDYLEIKTML